MDGAVEVMREIFMSVLEKTEGGGSEERFVELVDVKGDGLRVRRRRW